MSIPDDLPTWGDVKRDLRQRNGPSPVTVGAIMLLAIAVISVVGWLVMGFLVKHQEQAWVDYQERVERAEDDLDALYVEKIALEAKKIHGGRGTTWSQDVYVDGTRSNDCWVVRVNGDGEVMLTADRKDHPLALHCIHTALTKETR